MLIPFEELQEETLHALLEAYALREGTEYGEQEVSLDAKVEQLYRQLKTKKAFIVFDANTQSCSLVSKDEWQLMKNESALSADD